MRKSKLTKLLSVFLVFMFVLGLLPLSLFAASTTSTSFRRTLEEVRELLNTITYDEYSKKYENVPDGTRTYTINATSYVASETDANVKTETYDGVKALYTPDIGKTTWSVDVSSEGMYEIDIVYYPVEGKATSIERVMYIDGKVPFSEARALSMTKVWVDEYEGEFGEFRTDVTGNDIRPVKSESPEWRTYTASDSTGFYVEPFQFYFSAGEHSISLETVREPLAISQIVIRPINVLPTYEEYIAAAKAAGASTANAEPKKIHAENPKATSEQVIYPIYDRASPITEPQDASKIKLNTIGGNKWQTSGQWISYEIEVEESGLYQIVPRFRQKLLTGMFTSRRIRIDGEVPFQEASYCQFTYSDDWQIKPLNNGVTEFEFYLEAGTHVIEFEVVLGEMAEILSRVNTSLNVLNDSYLKILMITGATPDQYRDYNFGRLIPDTIIAMAEQAKELYNITDELVRITGQKGAHLATLNTIADLVKRMSSDEEDVAKNLANLKTYLGTLGTWLYTSREQSLEFDYIMVQPSTAKLPKANANFFQSAWFEIKSFVLSFFADYNTIGAITESGEESGKVTLWYTEGRDQAQILRQLIDYEFTPETGIAVELKLVAGGSLLPSILAGVGPDVSFLGSSDTINYAIRNAVLPIDQMPDFEEVIKRFPDVATIPLTLFGDETTEVYGLPSTMDFPMMFYRMDVFANLEIDLPETWQDMYSIIPVLNNNKMEIAFPATDATCLGALNLILYQMGGELYADNGKRINLDSNVGLTAFSTLCDLYEKYKFPLKYDFSTRFRTGEMPMGIQSYTTYNKLIIYASELRDVWEMVPLFGWEDENGNINNSAPASVSAIVMPRGAQNIDNAWELMCWFTDSKAQARYANELIAVLGPAGKYNTANIEALAELPWTADEYRALEAQMNNLAAIPEYPGGYIIDRETKFAFLNVVNKAADAVESMLDHITPINKEITRKRQEFNWEYYEISYSTNFIEAVD